MSTRCKNSLPYILAVLSCAAGAVILGNSAAVSQSVYAAVMSCLEVIVPSLWAFTMLAVYMQKSGLYRIALRPLTAPLSKLLQLDEELCAVFVLGSIGGFPVGARLLSALVKSGRLSAKDASYILCFCYGSGPSFMIGIVGIRIFGSAEIGAGIFAACALASLMIAVVICRTHSITLAPAASRCALTADTLVSSVTDTAKVMFTVCAMIVGFSVVTALLGIAGVSALNVTVFESVPLAGVINALAEISRISLLPASSAAVPLCAALMSAGGLCVVLQIAALAGEIPLGRFLVSRVPAGIITAALSLPLMTMCGENAEDCLAAAVSDVQPFSVNAAASACVLAMSVILLVSGKNGRDSAALK